MITEKGYAKINLTLDVLGKREDGFHEIISIMQTISLCDELTIKKAEEGVLVSWNLDLPCDKNNTVFRAASLMKEKYNIKEGIDIFIQKKIPIAAGLAGGSADAAATIIGINKLFGLDLTLLQMQEIGVLVGADVPFCLLKGSAIAKGIGERLIPIKCDPKCYVIVVKPDIDISTRDIYEQMDATIIPRRPNVKFAAEAIQAGDIKNVGQNLFNVMEYVTSKRYPIISEIKQKMVIQGAQGSLMSGSGPSVYGLFANKYIAENAYNYFMKTYGNIEGVNISLSKFINNN